MAIQYKPCEDSPNKEHWFQYDDIADGRCTWCDAKPWYVSIRADHPDGEPVTAAQSFASMTMFYVANNTASYRPPTD